MLKILSNALKDIDPSLEGKDEEHDLRVSMAALLVNASMADGQSSAQEREKISEVLKSRFSLDESESELLLSLGTEQDQKSVDLYKFTKTLAADLDQEGRQEFVKMMWEVILADGVIDDFEAHLIWRVSDLLGVSTRDRVRLRQQVENGNS